MKTATIKELKTELSRQSVDDLQKLVLKLVKYKKENKELLTYLLFESENENSYINAVKLQIDDEFSNINTNSLYLAKKTIRKVLRTTNKHIKYSGIKQTEVELLIYFCKKIKDSEIPLQSSKALYNIYHRQLEKVNTSIGKLHEDLQYDYNYEIENL
ncbi:MAG: hypothetical protein DRI86_03590 [Bacteroidetes bacterium]|nr:MAG: hypothetical protein DRI86_03590 [Bacteroidota bacterium]